ncbi:unnamed protein product [Onchocerca ochengi]|uniref:Protein aurora borealis n=1 Tax=Onchocerca ochengi TaxID=42157 RepID=A0A182ERK5_ONCOC|nr:unnamed protein product [Onchocerca ochengi]
MGVRSRFKDAMAVLERIPNPQSIRLPKFRILENEPSEEMYRMISLNILPHHSLPTVVNPVSCSSNDDEMQKRLEDNFAFPQKRSEDNSSNEQIVNIDLTCAESEMVSHYNFTDDEYLKHDSSATKFIRPISAEVCYD